ncbi:MAG: hypothetical protein QME25_03595 [Bacteroidota bacterium]|nr:hypothetical protein [Bacteroidota bacterium]
MIRKILIIWVVIELLMIIGMITIPNRGINTSSFINLSIQILLFLICLNIFLNEPTKRYKFLFLNFTIFFSTAFLHYILIFVGLSIFTNNTHSVFFFFQYTQSIIALLQPFAIAYLVIDLLFKGFKIYQKYLLTFVIVGGVFLYYFYPFIENPKYLYTTENIQKFRAVDQAHQKYIQERGKAPTVEELAEFSILPALDGSNAMGDLYKEKKLELVKFIYPYLEGYNFTTLLYRPLFFNIIYMHVFILIFILLYFGYYYGKDPPQGAYMDKIMFVFLIIAGLDIFHHWAVIKSVEYNLYNQLYSIGQYFTTAAFFTLVIFFYARLRFIKSVVGEFYETEIQTNPEKISRWLDGIDKFILNHFTSSKDHKTRLFEQQPVN